MDKFIKLWWGITDEDRRTNETACMNKIANGISEKIKNVQEFSVSDEGIRKMITERKNWTAPGVDSI